MRTSGVDAQTEAITRSHSTARGLDVAVLAVAAAIVIAVIAALLATLRRRSGGGAVERRPWPAGAWIAIGALALAVVPLFLLQLGSPVSPFMDTLPQAASPERVVTFRSYDPYHND